MTSTPSDSELVRALKAKQNFALKHLYDIYGDVMYGLALRILNNQQEAEDLIQEIFVSIWQECKYNPERGTLRTFLMLLVHSRAIDKVRSRKSILNTLTRWGNQNYTEEFTTIPLEEVVSGEISHRVQAALSELPEKQRQAIELAYYQGFSQSEIAKRLGVPIGTVKSWFRLSFVKLRQSLKDFIN